MKKILIILFLGLFIGAFFFINIGNPDNTPNTNTPNYNSSKILANNTSTPLFPTTTNTSTQLSSFSTKIYDKSVGRQNNIQITISKLDGVVIAPGAEFSFGAIVGKATAEKGYEKAKIFDKDGNVTEGYRWWKLPS